MEELFLIMETKKIVDPINLFASLTFILNHFFPIPFMCLNSSIIFVLPFR